MHALGIVAKHVFVMDKNASHVGPHDIITVDQ
jgi:hypothetical protein